MAALGIPSSRFEQCFGLVEECRDVQCDCIRIELEVAITFCQCACTTPCLASKNRILAEATSAYARALHFVEHAHLSESMSKEVEELELRLNSLLLVVRESAA